MRYLFANKTKTSRKIVRPIIKRAFSEGRRFSLAAISLLFAFSPLLQLIKPIPASAAGSVYLALGDSFSAGYGQDTASSFNALAEWRTCGRSEQAYPFLLLSSLGMDKNSPDFMNETCSGALAAGSYTSNSFGFQSIMQQFKELNQLAIKPTHITMTFGGNDSGFVPLLIACGLPNNDNCNNPLIDINLSFPQTDVLRAYILNTVHNNLVSIIGQAKVSWPKAKIWIAGYPFMFSDTSSSCSLWGGAVNFSAKEKQWIRSLSNYLNDAVASATSLTGVNYVDPKPFFEGHNLCDSGTSYFNQLFHPNDLGHFAYKGAFLRSGFGPLDPSTPANNGTSSGTGSTATNPCLESSDRLIMYENTSYGGRCASIGLGEYANLGSIGFYRQMSSLKMGSQLRAVFCEGTNFTGRCEGFDRTDEDIHNDSWGDMVGSLKVSLKPTPPPGGIGDPSCTPGPKRVVVYENTGFSGACTAMDVGEYPSAWMMAPVHPENMSSLKVGDDVSVQICAQDNFVDCTTWGTDSDLGNDGWNDRMRSMKIYLTPPQPVCAYNADQIAIHDWLNYRGSCATVDIGTYATPEVIPANLNDQIESMKIGANVKVWACADPNFGSTCSMISSDTPDLSVYAVKGQTISSFKVMRKTDPGPCDGSYEQVVVFTQPNYDGSCWVFDQGLSNMNDNAYTQPLNDKAQSVKVLPGAKATLCRDANQTGPCSTFTSSIASLFGTTVDRSSMTSILVGKHPAFICDPNSNQLAIYDQPNYTGECAIISENSTVNDLATFGRLGSFKIESIKVGSMIQGIICRDQNVDGLCEQFNNNDPDLADNLIGLNTVQSLRNRPKSDCDVLPGTVVFFDLPNYDGLCVRASTTDHTSTVDLSWLTSGRVESIKVSEDLQLKLCRADTLSICTTFRSNIPDLTGYQVGPNLTYVATIELRTFACVVNAYQSEYFDNSSLAGAPVTKRCETIPDYDWGGNAPSEVNVPTDNFSVRWTSDQNLPVGTYQFKVTADDGVRLWIDGNLVIDKWIDQGATTYTYDAVLADGDHSVKMEYYERGGGAVAKLEIINTTGTTVTPPPPPPALTCASTEYKAEYYAGIALSGTPTGTRCESSVNNDWGGSGPTGVGVGVDDFSIRWVNTNTYTAGTYRITATADDGVRVWWDNTLVIDRWYDQGATTYTSDQTVAAGTHTLKMEYYEKGGGAVAKLTIAPYQAPVTPPPTTGCTTSQFKAEYFNNITLSGTPASTRCENSINYNWGSGAPSGANVGANNFSIRWTNTNSYTAGTYRFSVTADDGVRLWIDGILVIDKWKDQGATTYTVDRNLTAASHTIKMEYYEKGGGAVAKFSSTKL